MVVVVHVAHREVVGTGVPGVGGVEEVVVDRHSRRDVVRPADAEGFVVFGEDAVGDRDVVRVLAEVDETVVHAGKLFSVAVSFRALERRDEILLTHTFR